MNSFSDINFKLLLEMNEKAQRLVELMKKDIIVLFCQNWIIWIIQYGY